MRRKAKAIICFLLLLSLVCSTLRPKDVLAVETVHISTAEELQALALECVLDSRSVGLTVYLDNDIDLSGIEFEPFAIFSGTFEGGGHTLSGLTLASDGANQALFRHVTDTAIIEYLNVSGAISPNNIQENIGGLAGTNHGWIKYCSFSGSVRGTTSIGGLCGLNNGTLEFCSVKGTVSGKSATGGLCGTNQGLIYCCANEAKVNTTIEAAAMDLNQISSTIVDVTNLNLVSTENSEKVSDSGGICGLNLGMITNSENDATVGYQHFGYNVGGIAGRSSGYVADCVNYGTVYGKQDVGGIIGQMEPYKILVLTESLVDELDALSATIDTTMSNMDSNSSQSDASIKSLKQSISDAAGVAVDINETNKNSPVDITEKDSTFGVADPSASSSKSWGQLESNAQKIQDEGSSLADIVGTEKIKDFLSEITSQKVNDISVDSDGIDPSVDSGEATDSETTGKGEYTDVRISEYRADNIDVNAGSPAETAQNELQISAEGIEVEASSLSQEEKDRIYSLADQEMNNFGVKINDKDLQSILNNGNISITNADGSSYVSPEQQSAIQDKAEDIVNKASSKSYEKAVNKLKAAQNEASLYQLVFDMAYAVIDLTEMVSDTNSQLAKDIEAVNEQYTRVSKLTAKLLNGEIETVNDISGQDTNSMTTGKVRACKNAAAVEGDTNVGGVAGCMGTESVLDLEELANMELTFKIQAKTYEARCICIGCTNTGKVTGIKARLGGIIGKVEMGIVTEEENYGTLNGQECSYVGGIVGEAFGAVSNSWAMCSIDGVSYVGGITGYSKAAIDNCMSLVNIDAEPAACGAITGWTEDINLITGNLYLNNGLGAVDGVSYDGRTNPISYEALMARTDLPEAFKELKLTFVADGEVIAEIPFTFGQALDEDQIPEIPDKSGYSGYWPEYDFSRLMFSDTIEAVYYSKRTTIDAQATRANSTAPVLMVEGSFDDRATVSVTPYSLDLTELSADKLTQYASIVENLLECWDVSISSNHSYDGSYTVHYLKPETKEKRSSVLLFTLDEEGNPVQISTSESGSYLVFSETGTDFSFFAIEAEAPRGKTLLVLGIILILLALLFLAFRKGFLRPDRRQRIIKKIRRWAKTFPGKEKARPAGRTSRKKRPERPASITEHSDPDLVLSEETEDDRMQSTFIPEADASTFEAKPAAGVGVASKAVRSARSIFAKVAGSIAAAKERSDNAPATGEDDDTEKKQ